MPQELDIVTYGHVFNGLMRYIAPAIAFILLLRCAWPLLTFRREPEIWARLVLPNGKKLPVNHWENVIGSSRSCDIVIELPNVSRNHGVLTRYDDGSWTISDAESKEGILVNGKKVDIVALHAGDVITIGGVAMEFAPISRQQEMEIFKGRTKASSGWKSLMDLCLLTFFQVLCILRFSLAAPNAAGAALSGYCGLIALQWALFLFYVFIRRSAFEVETIAFFLCSMGMAAICAVKPAEVNKQLLATVLGIGGFLLLGWSMRDLERAKKIRYVAAAGGVALLAVTLLFGKEYYGAKNWLELSGFSLQPSELSKVCFVYVGASTMDRLMRKRNLILFIGYTIVLCVLLALMNDFGTALIFFCAFLVIAYLRSGSVGTVALAVTALGFAGVIGVKLAPHALRRFTAWRHIWEDPWDKGFQQTQALMCIASGGLFGLGEGLGRMKKIFAADSDVVFATISEEWGLIMMVLMICAIVVLALFSLRCASVGRSSFYAIGACTAAGILLVQGILNALGTVDILPLTGVTFPFLSNGGSSMMATWCLLAFIKAADTRRNGSFAVRPFRRKGAQE